MIYKNTPKIRKLGRKILSDTFKGFETFPKSVCNRQNISVKRPIRRRKTLKSVKIPKEETRSQIIKRLDNIISQILLKDGVCKRCGKHHKQYKNKKGELKWHNFGASHYWSRDYMGARFELDNLDGLCWLPCHGQKWEHDKQGVYKDYMIKKLGQRGFERLEIKARGIVKFSKQDLLLLIKIYSKKVS